MAKKILIIAPAWIGDMVMAQVLFRALKGQQPDCVIDVLAPAFTHPLLSCMPEVRKTILLPLKHGEWNLRVRYQIGKSLRPEKYDQAIVLPNSWKSALIPFFARIPKRTGFCGEWRRGLLNDILPGKPNKTKRLVDQWILLVNEKTVATSLYPKLMVDEKAREATLQKYALTSENRPILALCPGAEYGEAKRWLPEYFAQVSDAMNEKNWQVVLLGSQKDTAVAEAVMKNASSKPINLVGQTGLLEAIQVLSAANAVLTNDSGLMHVAAALGRRVIALYGSSSPAFTPPLSAQATILWLHLSCSPCFARVCPLKHFNCMRELLPSQVLEKLS